MSNTPRRQLEAVIRNHGRHLARCLIRRGRYMIGQDRKNEIVVDEESMSARHARLTVVTDTELYIEDMDSANGVFVDGKPAEGMMRLTPGCKILLGQNTLDFQRGGLPATVFEHLPEGFMRTHRYSLGDVVVQGRTSTIYEAHDSSLNRQVALKAMLPESQASAQQVLRFVREAQIASQLQHPGIPPVYELSVDEQTRLFYTTRFVEGETLDAVLEALRASLKSGEPGIRERFPLSALMIIFQKVCDAVRFAHSHGVIHTALQPQNIVIGEFGEVFVTTWGLAKTLEPEINEDGTPSFQAVRAPAPDAQPALTAYSAPEQATDSFEQVDARTDVYALGTILYRIIFLQDAFAADNDEQLLSRILLGQHTPPFSLVRKLCPHWPGGKMPEFPSAVAVKAFSPNRDDRFQTVQELQSKIAAWQDGHATGGDLTKLLKGIGGLLGKH